MAGRRRSGSSLARHLGANIAALRKARGWTQSGLAERVDVDTETISRFERGATLPSLLTLEKVGKALRVGVGDLLAESSALPEDQVARVGVWLAELSEADRGFALDQMRRICAHLRAHGMAPPHT